MPILIDSFQLYWRVVLKMVDVKLGKLRIRNLEVFLIVACSFCIVFGAILFLEIFPGLNQTFNNFAIRVSDFGQQWGYFSAFLLSMFGNTSVFIVVPYSFVVYVLSATGVYNWILLGIISGLGAAIGEVTSYIVGRLAAKSKAIQESEYGEKFERMRKKFEEHPKAIPFWVFLFAMTPLPDDVILVPFGMMKYSYWKTVIPCWLGKTVLCLIIAAMGYYLSEWFVNLDEGLLRTILGLVIPRDPKDESTNPGQDVILLLVLFIVIYLMMRVPMFKGEETPKVREIVDSEDPGSEKSLENNHKDGLLYPPVVRENGNGKKFDAK